MAPDEQRRGAGRDRDTGEIAGVPPAAACPRCGEPNLAGRAWCARCGLALAEPAHAAPHEPPGRHDAVTAPRVPQEHVASERMAAGHVDAAEAGPAHSGPAHASTQHVALAQPWWRSTGAVMGALVAVLAGIGVVVFSMGGDDEPGAGGDRVIADAAEAATTSERPPPPSPSPSAASAPQHGQLAVGAATASTVLAPDGGVSYEPHLTTDGDPTTAWNDGVDGDPTGQWLEYTFTTPVRVSRIEVINGYDKVVNDLDLFDANARIRDVLVETDAGSTAAELRDTRDRQSLEGAFGPSCRVRVVVDSLYPGSRFDDVALSEIAFYGTQDLQGACG